MNPKLNEIAQSSPISALPTPSLADQLAASQAEVERLVKLADERLGDLERATETITVLQKSPLVFALGNLDAGAVLDEAGQQFRDLCETVLDRDEPGKFTIVLTVKPFKEGCFTVTAETKLGEPKPDMPPGLFYLKDGQLTRNDPRQRLTSTAELLAAGRALGQQPIECDNREPHIIVPDGYTAIPLPHETEDPLPSFISQRVTMQDAPSFIAYLKRFGGTHTAIFAQSGDSKGAGALFHAIIDYHEGGKGVEQKAARGEHVAIYPCPLSLEWLAWANISGKALKQTEFIDFIERNAPDVVNPSSASLMELALNFEAKIDVEFQSKMTRVTGGRQILFKENIEAGGGAGKITVPEALMISVPVFEGGKSWQVNARLEWNPRDGRLVVSIHLQRSHDAIRAALADIRDEIKEATGIEPYTGKIGSPS